MGGLPPLGYDAKDRQLIINEAEAATVQLLFETYLAVGSVRALKEEAERLGLRTKRRLLSDGREQGGIPFGRGHLTAILTNPIYCGMIRHRGQVHAGRHSRIIDAETWDAVQVQLKAHAPTRQLARNSRGQHLLTGFLFDETGDRLSPSHAVKQGRRYRYYISHRLMQARRKGGDGWRLPARDVERLILNQVHHILNSDAKLLDLTLLRQAPAHDQQLAVGRARHASEHLTSGSPKEIQKTLRAIIHRIVIHPGGVRFEIAPAKITAWLRDESLLDPLSAEQTELRSIEVPASLQRRGVEAKLVMTNGAVPCSVDQTLLVLIARAHLYLEHLTTGACESVESVAVRERTNASEVSRILPLAFLAPDIVRAVITGVQPVDLTAERLKRITPLPGAWSEQRQMLGFAPGD